MNDLLAAIGVTLCLTALIICLAYQWLVDYLTGKLLTFRALKVQPVAEPLTVFVPAENLMDPRPRIRAELARTTDPDVRDVLLDQMLEATRERAA